jgi:3-isopropylmalate/(R)-2-methylmalate dehydratase small subunit
VVIAPSYADIFRNNCFKNGVLPIILEEDVIDRLFAAVDATHGYQVTINLPAQQIHLHNGEIIGFDIDPFRKDCHTRGLDDIGLTLEHAGEIRDFEERHRQEAPWLFDKQN